MNKHIFVMDKPTKIRTFGGFKLDNFCIWKANLKLERKCSISHKTSVFNYIVSFKVSHREFKQPTSLANRQGDSIRS